MDLLAQMNSNKKIQQLAVGAILLMQTYDQM